VSPPERVDVPVAGGTLAAWRWPGTGPLVLAAHGITANGLSWQPVADALAGAVTLVAPDLRGRGRSSGLGGPYGMAAHAADLTAVLDHLGAGRTLVAGHSMGGFVAAALAARHPDRVRALVLVDGGLALEPPPDGDLASALGPAMARLNMTFPDRAAYRAFWRAHPALAGDWSDAIDDYAQHDLEPAPGGWRSSCVREAVETDGPGLYADVLDAVRCPVRLLWTERGLLGDPPGLYSAERLQAAGVPAEHVPDVNHYTILMAPRGADRVSAAIRTA
jgi:pimeloyl-ACP methyl ester carboxylesterase